MMKTFFLRWFPALLFLLLVLGLSAASAEVRVEFSPDAPRVGDYVDITVTGDREGATAVRYALSLGEEEVFKPDAKEKPSLGVPEGWERVRFQLDALPVERLFNPSAVSRRVLLQLHGGGYVYL